MKLISSFRQIFAKGKIRESIGDILENLDVAFCFLAGSDNVGKNSSDKVKFITDIFNSTNYLINSSFSPQSTLIETQPLLKGQPEIIFTASDFFLLKKPEIVKELFIIYRPVEYGYLLYMPRTLPGNPPTFYDAFPSGQTQLFRLETTQGQNLKILNARIQINGQVRPYDVFPNFGQSKLLTLSNIEESIAGFGGKFGEVGGGNFNNTYQPVYRGGISFILGIKEDLTDEKREEINDFLLNSYLYYPGTILLNSTPLKLIVGNAVNLNLTSRFFDEWYNVVSYELLFPDFLGLSLVNGFLVGTPTFDFVGILKIKTVNSAGFEYYFDLEISTVTQDPLVANFPNAANLTALFISRTGVEKNSNGVILSWEDARRNSIYLNNYLLDDITIDVDNNISIRESFEFSQSLSGKSFLFVYKQESYGIRRLLDSLPDIEGDGTLWTVPDANTIFGTTNPTQLQVTVGRIQIDLFRYLLPLGEYFIIVATGDNTISFSSLENNLGQLKIFASWSNKLTATTIEDIFDYLPQFLDSLKPQQIITNRQVFLESPITINLKNLISDPLNEEIVYSEIEENLEITNDILSFSTSVDVVKNLLISGINESGLTRDFTIPIQITIKNNPLYLNLKNNNILAKLTYIYDVDVVNLSLSNVISVSEYSGKSDRLIASDDIKLKTYTDYKNSTSFNFELLGLQHFTLLPTNTLTAIFMTVYLESLENNSVWFGNNVVLLTLFKDTLLSDTFTPLGLVKTVLNGRLSSFDTELTLGLNTVYFEFDEPVAISTLSKDRNISNRGIKGSLVNSFIFDEPQNFELLNKLSRDYYDPPRELLILRFESNIFNETNLFQASIFVQNFSTISIRGTFSLLLNSSFLSFESELFNLHYEDFTIRFFVRQQTNTALQTIFNLPGNIVCYIDSGVLKLGSSLNDSLYGEFTLPTNSWTFVTVSKLESNIYLIVNTSTVKTTIFVENLISTIFEISSGSNTTEVVNLEEFIFIRRVGYASVESVPTSSYVSIVN